MQCETFQSYIINKGGIRESQFEELAPLLRYDTFLKNDVLLQRGETCKASMFVEKGLLRAYTLDESGKEHIVQFAPENWFVGDRGSIYFNDPSYFSIDVIEDALVVFVTEAFIEKASEMSSSFRKFNEKLLHNHIQHLQKRIDLLLSASAESRYLNFIEMYPDLLLRVPQWMIASYLGITPESLSRVRKALADKNFKP
ncbi:Crp/Fnr family transcriptional regulator [Marixanthomonas sp. SCSIO 43207]|uniref:Crp/Fnr family transcriptional regulator n=1 Tax=Marixanthomonas sp. SCSIO 43207 TaxID=2779360 RepID=UPI001CA8AA97|nr:Crp/Fnr family transcriptional regulator [Marixanthomonas sp. SCSIO 43207]UAB80588.1 Crp/Fnr family transcriptional regulator [Marixanthomonas sp. SCSIO 43207]